MPKLRQGAGTVADANSRSRRPDGGTPVEFADVTRVFGQTKALDGLSLAIPAGQLLALLGPSGCGKTTALRILAGFDRPSTGRVLVGGSDVSRVPINRRDMGMVFQSYSLFPTMSALDNVAFGLRLRKEGKSPRRAQAGELLDLVGLSEHAAKHPHQLSGGQQQRVALARALAIQPRVLLLDEPLSALDAKVREQLRDEIRRIQVELGVTTLFVTHDQDEALSIADQVGVMRAGRLEQCAPPDDVYHRPATPFVAQFVGTMNRMRGHAHDDGQVEVGGQRLPIQAGSAARGAVDVLVRPEALVVTPDDEGAMVVVVATFRGATTRLRLRTGDGLELLADVPTHRAAQTPPGSRVAVRLIDRPVLVESA